MSESPERTKRFEFIEDWRQAWRFWSVRLAAAGGALQALLAWWPDAALVMWNSMPDEVKALLPQSAVMTLPLLFFAASIVARILKQKNIPNG